MENGRPPPRRVTDGTGIKVGEPGWFGRILAIVLGVVVLAGAAMLSVVLLVVLFGLGTVAIGYVWWKTRGLRRQARAFGDEARTVDVEAVQPRSPDDNSPRN
ncbi:hypothetical protein AWB75_05070 [Caballeronia catudaia]|uniref:Uncharacterized protein n=1 Tax=Caballeronia catudaia TaxID=1777136 RepID=A0A158CG20_9BURK|nr:hypothetical protein [Caballeronia catudaia]SAK81210.1 hypothetical protein AWB75_05070 [Caballeronia catudaia]